jgi:hypothetical protein
MERVPVKIRNFAMALLIAATLSGPAAFAQGGGSVVNATFTSSIVNGAPTDFPQQFSTSTSAVYYYGELLDLAGQTVTLRWSLEGKRMQDVPVVVTSARQPAWTMMKMQPQWTGNWTVEVLNGKGQVIGQRNFAYNPPM